MAQEIHPVDVYVGRSIRKRRSSMGISQTDLAKSLGVTFQQVQKYETGKNRIGASRLYDIATMLGTTVSFFFQDIPKNYNRRGVSDSVEQEIYGENDVMNRELLDLVKSYQKILDPALRKKMLETIKYIANSFDFEPGNEVGEA